MTTFLGDSTPSTALLEGALTVENFVFSPNNYFLEYNRQRRDFSPETIQNVQTQWLLEMTNEENFGKMIGLSLCTKKKAKFLSKFL